MFHNDSRDAVGNATGHMGIRYTCAGVAKVENSGCNGGRFNRLLCLSAISVTFQRTDLFANVP
jgi:hypothetical protein